MDESIAVAEGYDSGEVMEGVTTTRLAYLEDRITDLTIRLESLYARLAALEESQALLLSAAPHTEATADAKGKGARKGAKSDDAGAEPQLTINDVLTLVLKGEAQAAQQLLLSLPKEEMERQPGIVALAAATLCIQRGDLRGGLTALHRARQFTEDPRLLKVIERLEGQIGVNAS
jgi:hypothetical protein